MRRPCGKAGVGSTALVAAGGLTGGADEESDAQLRQRVLARPGMTVEKLESLLARQMPQAEKKGRATWLFDTAQSRATIETQVADLVAELRRQAQ